MTMKGKSGKPGIDPAPIKEVLVEASPDDSQALGQVLWQEKLSKVGYVPDKPLKGTFVKPAKAESVTKMTLTRSEQLARMNTGNKIL